MPVANKADGIHFPGTPLPYYMRRLMANYQCFFVVSWMRSFYPLSADSILITATFKLCSRKLLTGTSLQSNECLAASLSILSIDPIDLSFTSYKAFLDSLHLVRRKPCLCRLVPRQVYDSFPSLCGPHREVFKYNNS